MQVFGYLRVSGKSQVEGDGFPRQQAAIDSFCKAQGLSLITSVREEGVSGTVEGMDRPAFSDMLEGAVANGVEAIVVERMDRLARDLMVSEMLLRECRTRNIKVFSCDQGQLIDMASNGGDPTRVLIRQIMGSLAEWEKTMLVKKLRAAKDRIKASGGYAEGTLPYGRKNGSEQRALDLMLEWQALGCNFSQIARHCNTYQLVNRAGRFWSAQNVRLVLNNHKKQQSKK